MNPRRQERGVYAFTPLHRANDVRFGIVSSPAKLKRERFSHKRSQRSQRKELSASFFYPHLSAFIPFRPSSIATHCEGGCLPYYRSLISDQFLWRSICLIRE